MEFRREDRPQSFVHTMGDFRLVEREYRTSRDLKNGAIPQATHPWVSILDTDERLTFELASEIHVMLQSVLYSMDTGSTHAVTIGNIPSLDRFQVHPNGKSRVKDVGSKGLLVVRILLIDEELSRELPLGGAGTTVICTKVGGPFHVFSKIAVCMTTIGQSSH